MDITHTFVHYALCSYCCAHTHIGSPSEIHIGWNSRTDTDTNTEIVYQKVCVFVK